MNNHHLEQDDSFLRTDPHARDPRCLFCELHFDPQESDAINIRRFCSFTCEQLQHAFEAHERSTERR